MPQASSAAPASGSTAPEIRTFQFDDNGIGAIRNSVNLFRGDVNFSFTLLKLPSRHGLEVSLDLLYQSNVNRQANEWNLTAPTGIVGLGWSLPFSRIEVDASGTAAIEDNAYVLYRDETPIRLLRSSLEATLFEVPSGQGAELDRGVVSPALRKAFAARGFALSAEVAATRAEGGWRLADGGHERVYTLRSGAKGIAVADGGLAFEAEGFNFWRIHYYPDYESWRVTTTDGLVQVYGGDAGAAAGTVQWGVRWGNWIGASSRTEGQERFATGWNLARSESRWGDRVLYTYETVEQAVGAGGLAYTKAAYLSTITDVFDRTVRLRYREKRFEAKPAAGPREFLDPHKAVPDAAPNAFQDRYETRFLDRVEVAGRGGEELYRFELDYALENVTGLARTDRLYGDTVKRYLTGIRQVNPEGDSLPGMLFGYATKPTDPNPGALRSITYPQGGVATYTYESKTLPVCERSLRVDRPTDSTREAWVPRVWFGSDYAVTAWFNTDSNRLRVAVYTWVGFWFRFETTEQDVRAPIKLDTLSVVPGRDLFALSFEYADRDRTSVYLFHKVPDRVGPWRRFGEALDFTSLRVQLAVGDGFVVALDPVGQTLERVAWTFDPAQLTSEKRYEWRRESFPLQSTLCANGVSGARSYFLAAAGNVYTVFCYDRGGEPGKRKNRLSLFYRDALGAWQAGGTTDPNGIDITAVGQEPVLRLAPGASFLAAAYLTSGSTNPVKYDLAVFHWDAAYRFTDTFTLPLQVAAGVSFAPVVRGNSLIGSGTHLLRYDGAEWLERNLGTKLAPAPETIFQQAYGSAVGTGTENGAAEVVVRLGAYDANTDSGAWTTPVRTVADVDAPPVRFLRYFATVAEDYLSIDRAIYFRGSGNDWAAGLAAPIFEVPAGQTVDTTTMQNQSPGFFAYLELEDDGSGGLRPRQTRIVNLRNGRVVSQETFAEQIFRVYDQGRAKPVVSGKAPAGPLSLFTYPITRKPGDQLNAASHVTLRRWLQDAVAGQVASFPVVRLEIADGFGVSATAYQYDETTAGCDASGTVVKYFRAWTYPGASSPGAAKNGRSESRFINGVPEPGGDQQVLRVLDGVLEGQSAFDAGGREVSRDTFSWNVETVVSAGGRKVSIRGSYALLARRESRRDGIDASVANSYDLGSGQVAEARSAGTNAEGKLETWVRRSTYGYQRYPDLAAHNVLVPVIQALEEVTVAGAARPVTTQTTATRWKAWSHRAPGGGEPVSVFDTFDTYAWLGGAASPIFTAFDAAQRPAADWRRTSSVSRRTNLGLIEEIVDVSGRTQSSVYDRNEQYLIAQIGNASVAAEEGAYYGFEPYERNPGWVVGASADPAQFVVRGTAHVGEASLRLAKSTTGERALTRTFRPADAKRTYLFTAWYKSEPGFVPAAGAGWRIEVSDGSKTVWSTFAPFEATGGRWAFLSRGIPLGTLAGAGLRVTLAGTNRAAAGVLVDDLRFSPLVGSFGALYYDQRYDLELAALTGGPATHRSLYDGFQRQTADVGPESGVTSLTSQGFSRQEGEAFQPTRPNLLAQTSGRASGFYSDFTAMGGFAPAWTAAAPARWTVEAGVLRHLGTASDTITLTEPSISERYAAAVRVFRSGALSKELGLRVGSDLTLAWSPAARTWTLADAKAGKTVRSELTTAQVPGQWQLVVYDRVLWFAADGRPVFSYVADRALGGRLGLFAGDPVGFGNVALAAGAELSLQYLDGAGQGRQTQLLEGTGAIIAATLYDELGRPAVTTKPARLAPTAADPVLLGWRSRFVTSFDWVSGLMKGEVSDFYSGGEQSDDQGYPYARTRFEAAPTGRKVEEGRPGKVFAIVDLGTTKPAQRHTTKYAYGPNDLAGFRPELPRGRYYQTLQTDPDGVPRVQWRTVRDEVVAIGAQKQGGGYVTTGYRYLYDDTTSTVVTLLPNFFDPPDPATQQSWTTRNVSDKLGLKIRSESPDSGVLELVYDPQGSLRFSQDARGRAEGYYLYSTYDAVERALENGFLEGAFDRAALQRIADLEPDRPRGEATWHKRFRYDGEGDDPLQLGNLVEVEVARSEGGGKAAGARETLEHDVAGNVRRHVLANLVTGESDGVRYEYDHQGAPTRVTVEGGEEEVRYSYNQVGRLATVGDAGAADRYAAFTYNADSTLATTVLARGAANEVRRTHRYASPGWVRRIEDPYYAEDLYYDRGPGGESGYFNGQISRQELRLLRPVPAGVAPAYSYTYAYDSTNRMTSAINRVGGTVRRDASIGLDTPVSYDDNGNFKRLETGGDRLDFAYDAGRDTVKNTDGSAARAYAYDPLGNVTAALPRGLTGLRYNRYSLMTEQVLKDGAPVSFQYGGRNQRIRKASGDDSRSYVLGLDAFPLVERIAGTAGPRRIFYVRGMGRLLGIVEGGKLSVVLPDNQGSTRLLVAPGGKVSAAYSYMPFGDFIDRGETGASVSYLFTGQELDRDLGLYNFRARFYDPRIGRFYAIDPKAQLASPYIYGADDPILFIDPTGEAVFLIAALIIGAVLGAAGGGALAAASGEKDPLKITAYVLGGAAIGAASGLLAAGGAALGAAAGGAIAAGAGATAGSTAATAAGITGGVVGGAVGGAAAGAFQGASMAGLTVSLGGNADIGREAWIGAVVGGVGGALGGGFGTAAGAAGNAAKAGSTAAKVAALTLKVGGPIVTGGVGGATNASLQGGDWKSILTAAGLGAGIGLTAGLTAGYLNDKIASATFTRNLQQSRFGQALDRAGFLPELANPNGANAQAQVQAGPNPRGPFDQPLGYFYGSRIGAPPRIAVQSLNSLIWS